MFLLMFLDRFGEEERAPVGKGANDAAVLEEESAGLMSDSERSMLVKAHTLVRIAVD